MSNYHISDLIDKVVEGNSPREVLLGEDDIDYLIEDGFEEWFQSLMEDESLDEDWRRLLGRSKSKSRDILKSIQGRVEKAQDDGAKKTFKKLGKSIKRFAKNTAYSTKKSLKFTKKATKKEGKETKEMMRTFFKLLKRKVRPRPGRPPSTNQVRAAIAQLKDVGRLGIVASSFLVPMPGLLMVLELAARQVGTSVFPSALRGD